MHRLEKGGEPIATEEEVKAWRKAWWAAHPGQDLPSGDAVPWPICRAVALEALGIATCEFFTTAEMVAREAGLEAFVEWESEEDLRREWRRWRQRMIQQYRLEGFLPEAISE